MGAPSASTRIEAILRPLVREVMQWNTENHSPDLLADDLIVLLCREVTRQQLAGTTDPLSSLDALGLTPQPHWEERTANAYFPWAPVCSVFAKHTKDFNFLLREPPCWSKTYVQVKILYHLKSLASFLSVSLHSRQKTAKHVAKRH